MRVGYVRVSSVEQNEERQIVELKQKADVEKFFVDKLSSKSAKRPKFDEMMNFLREGDELIVSEFSRLARSTTDLLNIVDSLTKKDVKVLSLKEQLDTSTPQGRFMLTIFGAIAEFERNLFYNVSAKVFKLPKPPVNIKDVMLRNAPKILTFTNKVITTGSTPLLKLPNIIKFLALPFISGYDNNFKSTTYILFAHQPEF